MAMKWSLAVVVFAILFVVLLPVIDDLDWGFRGLNSIQRKSTWGFTEDDIPNLEGKTFLVTGANSGLGFWTVYHLVSHNARVVMHCRTSKKCDTAQDKIREEFPGAQLSSVLFDLSDFHAIKKGMTEFSNQNIQLDGLILNAGLAYVDFQIKSGLEMHITVNHFGYYLIVKYLWGQLVDSSKPMTVTVVSSAAHYLPFLTQTPLKLTVEEINEKSDYNSAMAYGRSKLANVLFSNYLAKKLRPFNTYVNSVHPGAVATNILQHSAEYLIQAKHFLAHTLGLGPWTGREGSLTQVFTAVSPNIFDEDIYGKYFHPQSRETTPFRNILAPIYGSSWTQEDILQKEKDLWTFSENYVNDFFGADE